MIHAMVAYNPMSGGGSDLAEALNIPRIKHIGSKFKGNPAKTIVNWGCSMERMSSVSSVSEINKCKIINHPEKVDLACNKVKSFKVFRNAGVSIPDFTTDRVTAQGWLNNGFMVFARTQLNAHSGKGIVIMDPDHPDTWEVAAPLYVKYIPKKYEYRIHVMNGAVIDTQRKGLKAELQGTEGINHKIRNLANGFVYVRNDGHVVPEIVKKVGVEAVVALGLDFGAADVIFNEKQQKAYCLEVNTSPGLQGETIQNYAQALSKF